MPKRFRGTCFIILRIFSPSTGFHALLIFQNCLSKHCMLFHNILVKVYPNLPIVASNLLPVASRCIVSFKNLLCNWYCIRASGSCSLYEYCHCQIRLTLLIFRCKPDEPCMTLSFHFSKFCRTRFSICAILLTG